MAEEHETHYAPSAGENITTTCQHLAIQAALYDTPMTADFNGIRIEAQPGATAEMLQADWDKAIAERRAAYEASPEGQEFLREQRAMQARIREAEKAPLAEFDVADAQSWATWLGANKDAYGAAVIRYAARWANLMEAQLKDGKKLEEIAEKTSHEADIEGITGFMYGAAVSVLATSWRHGDALRRWHNLDTQIGNEGEKANEEGGVLNPALLNLG